MPGWVDSWHLMLLRKRNCGKRRICVSHRIACLGVKIAFSLCNLQSWIEREILVVKLRGYMCLTSILFVILLDQCLRANPLKAGIHWGWIGDGKGFKNHAQMSIYYVRFKNNGLDYLGIKCMLENLTECFCIVLRFPSFCGEQDGGFDSLGHGLSHEFGGEFHSPARGTQTCQMQEELLQ